jgi:hypothetical protein
MYACILRMFYVRKEWKIWHVRSELKEKFVILNMARRTSNLYVIYNIRLLMVYNFHLKHIPIRWIFIGTELHSLSSVISVMYLQ